MKKSYLMIAAAAALFAACSSNDSFREIDVQEAIIGFNGQYVEKQTKAEISSSWLTTAGSDFGVFGYRYAIGHTNPNPLELFNNERVYYVTSPSADWVHTTVRYWDKSASDEYYFYAYAPHNDNASFNRAANGGLSFPMPVDASDNTKTQVFVNSADATDLCIAAKETTDYEECSDAHVHFTFSHALSKLSFKVKKEGFGANDVIRLTSISFAAPISSTATWNQNALTGIASANVNYTGLTAPASSTTNVKTAFNDSGADTPDDPSTTETDESQVNGIEDVIVGTTAGNIIAGSNSFIVIPNANPADPTDVQDSEKHLIKLTVGYELEYSDGKIESQTAYGDVALLYEGGNHYIVTINIMPVAIEFHVDAINEFNVVDSGAFIVQ